MNKKWFNTTLILSVVMMLVLSACGAQPAPTMDYSMAQTVVANEANPADGPACTSDPAEAARIGQSLTAEELQAWIAKCNTPAGNPTSMPNQPTAMSAGNGNGVVTLTGFTPNWTGLDSACPSKDAFLKAHGLTADQVIFHPAPSVSWEPCQFVIELKPEWYGRVTIPLINGYAYTLAPVNTDVTDMWGGDSAMPNATIQWGFTAHWGKPYLDLPYKWLDPANPCEWLVRDWRFGRYWRLENLGIAPSEVPYYDRVGPYTTLPGNVSCPGWVPPSIDQTVPDTYLQAAAMLGGLANASEWQHSPDKLNWAWKYSAKVSGSGDYCPSGIPCWQTTYLPPNSRGYIELWANGGPQKYYAAQLADLMLGNLNVDEFSYHSDPNK